MRSHRPHHRRRRFEARTLQLEMLEVRRVFSGDVAWNQGAALTLSFTPDGTQIGEHTSSLFNTLAGLNEASWQEAVIRGFQTWAQYVNVNLGVVDDWGMPFGILNDASVRRFGEIRIGAVPMSSDTLAFSIPNDEYSGGSWSGDVLFNSEGNFADLDVLFKVALHEAGHVLGLEHNPDPLSPMYRHTSEIETTPTADDIDRLMALYGARSVDRNEKTKPNDTLATATRMGLSDDDLNYSGATPAFGFGSISTPSDVDYFELPALSGYNGPISFQLRTRELSLLQATLTIFDQNGVQVGQGTGSGHLGDVVTVITPSAASTKYFARVEGASADMFGVGGYVLVGSYVQRQTASDADVARLVDQAFRLLGYDDSSIDDLDLQAFLENGDFLALDDDAHTDDADQDAMELEAVVASAELLRYRTIATITDNDDNDVYRVYSAERQGQTQFMTVAIESLAPEGLIPEVVVRNRHGQVLPASILANGAGLYVAEVSGIESDRQYFVDVHSAAEELQYATGNYSLAVTFTDVSAARETIATGELTPTSRIDFRELYIAKTQLLSLLLETDADAPTGVAWMAVYDSAERPLYYLAAPVGESRSASSLLLDPGQYFIEFGIAGDSPTSVNYALRGKTISQPIGPPLVDATTTPVYQCPGTPESYCYPGGTVTDSAISIATTTANPQVLSVREAIIAPTDGWFWSNNRLSTNVLLPLDTNGDGSVSAPDAILIINDLNASGARLIDRPPASNGDFLDVNHDGMISPLDALLIINHINTFGITARTAPSGELPANSNAWYWIYYFDTSRK